MTTTPRSISRRSAAWAASLLAAGALTLAAVPVHAQEMDDQSSGPTPQPLISVVQGPAVPAGGPPPGAGGEMPPLPAMYSEPIGPFAMYMDVIATGPSPSGLFAAPGCVLDGVYKRGMKLVWRFEVYDLTTGMRVTDRDGSTASVTLPDGTVARARFEARGEPGNIPPDAPWTWVAVWNIPADYPLGPVDYVVNVTTADGRTGSMQPSSWGSIYPMIVD